MDRRQEPRLTCQQGAFLTVLNDPHRTQHRVTFLDQSGTGARIALDVSLRVGQLVRLDLADGLLLGEVIHVAQDAQGRTAGLRLEHTLTHLLDLRNLLKRLELAERDAPQAAPVSWPG